MINLSCSELLVDLEFSYEDFLCLLLKYSLTNSIVTQITYLILQSLSRDPRTITLIYSMTPYSFSPDI